MIDDLTTDDDFSDDPANHPDGGAGTPPTATGPDAGFLGAMTGAELLDGTALQPWSPARKLAAQSMGMLYPAIGEDGAEQMARTGLYPGALLDTIIYLWLCASDSASRPTPGAPKATAPLSAAEIQQVTRKPLAARERALAWAERHDLIDMNGPAFGQGYKLFMDKLTAEARARVKPQLPAPKPGSPEADPNV